MNSEEKKKKISVCFLVIKSLIWFTADQKKKMHIRV